MDDRGNSFFVSFFFSYPARRKCPGTLRPPPGYPFLPGGGWWRPFTLAAPFLVVWSSRGLYPHLASLRYDFGNIAGLLTQTYFRLYLHCLVWRGYWFPQLHCV